MAIVMARVQGYRVLICFLKSFPCINEELQGAHGCVYTLLV